MKSTVDINKTIINIGVPGQPGLHQYSIRQRTDLLLSYKLHIQNYINFSLPYYFFPNPFLFLKADCIFAAAASTSGSLRSISKLCQNECHDQLKAETKIRCFLVISR